jgi:dephospho-CoA kinase
MILLGITGQIASGKTTAAMEFVKLGGEIISADEIGKQVVEKNPPVLSKLIRAFGCEIVDPDGKLQRKILGNIVFFSEEKRNTLNRIVHPPLLKMLKNKIEKCRENPECKLLIIDAALLIDWNLHKTMDYTICVIAPEDIQINRLTTNGFSVEEAKNRIKSQKTVEELQHASDYTINNVGDINDLRKKVGEIHSKIMNKKD